ncbi:MAG: type 1 glutamine amidotransferase [Rhodothermales bacterium]|nr:type 1 glutamine amidotransferase [Rhodothermales bacterium]MBO6780990.1 type 1 glutamine amidotransferase [Rhodothermales bacterium]
MQKYNLEDTNIAILVADGFEEVEFTEPLQALKDARATTHVISINRGTIRSWNDGNWNREFNVDKLVYDVDASDYDGLLIPGGVINPDLLRRNEDAVDFVRDFFVQSKPVAAICHAPWMLVEADVLEGRTVTSFKSIKRDVKNAGATWVDEEVVVDEGLVTSRNPDDLPAFCDKMVEEFYEGKHAGQHA